MAEKKKNRLWVIIVAVIAISAVAANLLSALSDKVDVTAIKVEIRSIQAYVDERGYTSLPHVYHVTMPMQGRILPLKVTEGDRVIKGQLIAKLEDLDWQDALLEVESFTATFQRWLEASKAQLEAAKIRMDFDKWDWERHKELAQKSAISEREKRDINRNFLDSTVQVESSEAMFFATKAMQSIVDLLPGYVNRNFDRTIVKSPVPGTILKRHVWNEKVMAAGSPLLDIGNLEELEITAEVLTEEAVHIHPTDKVLIYGSSLGDKKLEGRIRLVEPKAFTKVSSLGVEEQRVLVKIAFTPEAEKLIQDNHLNLGLKYRVRVKIITKEKADALVIPRTALFYSIDGNWQLYKVVDGKAELITVQTGLINDLEAEIVEGIGLGDTIITVPQASLEDGVKVNIL